MQIVKFTPLVAALAIAACGGGGSGGSGSGSAAPKPTPTPSTSATVASPCAASVAANSGFSCKLSTDLANARWELVGAPEGMVIQPASGTIHWTPLSGQTGTVKVNARAVSGSQSDMIGFDLSVSSGKADAAGIYVSPTGSDSAAGTAAAPFLTLQKAVDNVRPGETIFLRGGEYRNAEYGKPYAGRKESTLVQISTGGTAASPITLRPLGNEYVTLRSDVTGIRFGNQTTDYWIIKGLELVGNAQDLDEDIALANWWSDDDVLPMQGRGIGGQMDHITVEDCIVHDFPGAGIAPRQSEYVTIRNNIVYNNAWWSTAGTHGITVSSMKPGVQGSQQSVVIARNAAFANQSLIISHVFSKGKVSLVVDEGNGIHLQNNAETFAKEALVEENLAFWNGKAGLGINTMDRATIRRNSFYRNSRVVKNNGEVSVQSSTLRDVSANLFHPRADRQTYKDFQNTYSGVGSNATIEGIAADSGLPASVVRLAAVFRAPGLLDFRPAAAVPSGMGVPVSVLDALFARMAEYGIVPIEPSQPYQDEPYLLDQKKRIIASWPAAYRSLELEDKALGYTYTYAQRCHYPKVPAPADCP